MVRADHRVVVSHVGSLVRTPAMIPCLEKNRDKEPYDAAPFERCLADSLAEVVRLQAEAGIEVVSDGEYGKSADRVFYVHRRLSGLTWQPYTAEEAKDPTIAVIGGRDRGAFPEFPRRSVRDRASRHHRCRARPTGGRRVHPYQYEKKVPPMTLADYRKGASLRIDALNLRFEGCRRTERATASAGQLERTPHVRRADQGHRRSRAEDRCRRLWFAANPRHEHEWKVWKDMSLPAGKALMPGLIAHSTNVVEQFRAARQPRYADIIGRNIVMAGTDCGFS